MPSVIKIVSLRFIETAFYFVKKICIAYIIFNIKQTSVLHMFEI